MQEKINFKMEMKYLIENLSSIEVLRNRVIEFKKCGGEKDEASLILNELLLELKDLDEKKIR